MGTLNHPVTFGGNNRRLPGLLQRIKHPFIGVIRFVGQEGLRFKIRQKRISALQIGSLPWGQKEAGRVPQRIGRRMNFGAQSAFTAADGFVLALFFWAPALC